MPNKKSVKHEANYCAIKTVSLLDLVRNSCSTSGSPVSIFAIRQKGSYRLILTGEKLGDLKILYYFDTDKIAKFIVYSPFGESEKLEMKDSIDNENHDYKSYKIQVIELLNDPFSECFSKKQKVKAHRPETKLLLLKVKEYDSLVRESLSIAAEDEKIGKVYYFESSGKGFICSLDHFDDADAAIVYSEAESKNIFSFMRYNYINNQVESVNSFEGATYTPLAVIRLAEPFPFFKPE